MVAVIGFSLAVASASWVAYRGTAPDAAALVSIALPALLGVGALVGVRGCYVEVADGVVRDVAVWFTLRRVEQATVTTARVRRGPWRLYVLELVDGEAVKLVGASPLQFPTRLVADARTHDMEDLDVLLGPDAIGVDRR